MATVATIGVYGFTAAAFLDALRDAGMGRLLDVRQRRGVRGSEYAWANAARLEAALGAAGIEYEHHRELAPTTELRELQYAADAREGVGKRSRAALAPEYVTRYTREILDHADLDRIAERLPATLMCVERDPEACHRSLIADRLASEAGADLLHLRP